MIKNDLLLSNDFDLAPINAWGKDLFVRNLTGHERTKLRAMTEKGKDSDADTWLVIFTLCDANGQKIFDDKDFEAVNGKSASVISKIALAALKVNGLAPDSVEQAKNA